MKASIVIASLVSLGAAAVAVDSTTYANVPAVAAECGDGIHELAFSYFGFYHGTGHGPVTYTFTVGVVINAQLETDDFVNWTTTQGEDQTVTLGPIQHSAPDTLIYKMRGTIVTSGGGSNVVQRMFPC